MLGEVQGHSGQCSGATRGSQWSVEVTRAMPWVAQELCGDQDFTSQAYVYHSGYSMGTESLTLRGVLLGPCRACSAAKHMPCMKEAWFHFQHHKQKIPALPTTSIMAKCPIDVPAADLQKESINASMSTVSIFRSIAFNTNNPKVCFSDLQNNMTTSRYCAHKCLSLARLFCTIKKVLCLLGQWKYLRRL